MVHIKVKPLSLNNAYRGRRFATQELKDFKHDVYRSLPHLPPQIGKLSVSYRFGVSSRNSDGDNLVKTFQDCLADKYGFNDKNIYRWTGEKVDVKKGEEFVEFELSPF